MAVGVASDQRIKLQFYSTDGCVLILASWDEAEDENELDAEALAQYFARKCGGL